MKRNIFLVFVWLVINPLYAQINFNEKINIYDIDSLSTNIIYDDFDNDNDIDFIKFVSSNQKNVLLHKNENGNLNLSLPKFIGSNVKPIISLDINNDHYPDIITYHSFNTIGVLYNLQNDTFSDEQTLINFTGSYNISPIKFDYNNDGFIDLIVTDIGNNVNVLINNQNGGFLPQQFLMSLGSSIASIYKIDDFDNDGDYDLYIFDYNLKVYLNNNGNFTNPNLINVAVTPFKEFGILDIDANGYKDILYWKNDAIWAKYFYFDEINNQVGVLNDLPVIQGIPFSYYSNNSCAIYIKNINSDIYSVYLALTSTTNQSNIHKFSINDGLFSSSEVVLSNYDINIFNLNDFKFLDLNNNGNVDFTFSSNFNSQNMLFINYDIDNLSDKTICIQQTINPAKFTINDMNGDGIEDICVGQQNGLSYFEKMIDNEHRTIKNLIGVVSSPNASIFTLNNIMDFDNDGLGDVIDYSDSDMYAKIFKNLGDDNFIFIQNVSLPILTDGVFFVDLDNDGYKDMLFKKNYYVTGDELIWARNNNGINFEEIETLPIYYTNPFNTISLAFDDINSDGDLDIVMLSNYFYNDIFSYEIILFENQNGIFSGTSVATLIDDYAEGIIKLKDLDQDGDIDLFVYDKNEKPFLHYRNDGQNDFYKTIIDNINLDDIEFDDSDGDGKFEIYAMNYNSALYLSNIFYYSTSDFLNYEKIEIDSYGASYDSRADLLLFDYNNDNKKDIFINNLNISNATISVYLNNSNTLSIQEIAKDNNLKIFPNPFTNSINWKGASNKTYKLKLFSLNGKILYDQITSNTNMDFSFLESGIYLLVIEDIELNSRNTYKIIKK